MDSTSDHLPRGVVAVFDDDRAAQRAATALRSIGVADDVIHTGGPSRGRAAIRGEDELTIDQAVDVDAENVVTTGVATIAVAVPIGALLALPFALIPFGGWPLWVRAICVALVGAVAAAVWATVMRVPSVAPEAADPSAGTEQGVVLQVDDYSTQIARVLESMDPVSIDVIDLR